MNSTIENFCDYVSRCNLDLGHDISIQGVPCPRSISRSYDGTEFEDLVNVRVLFNQCLKKIAQGVGFGFLDVHALTDRGDGVSNSEWYLDHGHLTPQSIQISWDHY